MLKVELFQASIQSQVGGSFFKTPSQHSQHTSQYFPVLPLCLLPQTTALNHLGLGQGMENHRFWLIDHV